ncbi:MAG: helix-turn-helix transcriptional regulator [Bacteroidota bacterium]
MVERILELIKSKKLTPSQFADEIGIQRSGISHIISGRNKPSLEFVMKILKRFPDVGAEWLLYGTKVSGNANPTEVHPVIEPVKTSISEFPAVETAKVQAPEKQSSEEIPLTLMEEQDSREVKAEIKQARSLKRDKPGRKIEKIVVFYDDRSFREYDPE